MSQNVPASNDAEGAYAKSDLARCAESPNGHQLSQSFDLFELPGDYFDNPQRWLRMLRDYDPIHVNSDGSVLLTRYHDVRTVWRDRSAVVDKSDAFLRKFGPGPLYEHHTTAMLFRDPPDHDRLRVQVNRFFEPASLVRFRPFIENLVQRLLGEAADRRRFDFVHDFAERIPISLITQILGVPAEDGDFLRPIGLRVLFPLNPKVSDDAIADGHAAVAEFTDYITEHVKRVRRRGVAGEPANVIEALVGAQARGQSISDDEITHMCLLVFNGGHETTTNLIAVGTHSLLSFPDEYAKLPHLSQDELSVAVEELVRYVTPLQFQGRRTTKGVELSQGSLSAGTEVILCQASANRDERVFDKPDELNLGRKPNAHVSFGLGVHACLGNQLARLEAKIVFPMLARRFPRLTVSGPAVFNPNVRFRGLHKLPVDIGAV